MKSHDNLILKMFGVCALLIAVGFAIYILGLPSVGNVVIVAGIAIGVLAFVVGYLNHPS